MTLREIILFAIQTSVALSVFAVGLHSTTSAMTYLFRHPGKLVRSLVAMDVIMPLFALGIVLATSIPAPVKIALTVLSVAPVPAMLPKRLSKASGADDYIVGILFAAAVIACVFVPLAVKVIGMAAGADAQVRVATVAGVMAMSVLAPLVAGIVVRRRWPHFAERIVRPLSLFALILLVLATLPVLYIAVPEAISLAHDGSVAALAAFVLVGLAVGHFLGGPDAEERTVLAMATATRHLGVAIAVVSASFPDDKLAIAAVALYLLVNIVFATPYLIWRQRQRDRGGEAKADYAPRTSELRAMDKDDRS